MTSFPAQIEILPFIVCKKEVPFRMTLPTPGRTPVGVAKSAPATSVMAQSLPAEMLLFSVILFPSCIVVSGGPLVLSDSTQGDPSEFNAMLLIACNVMSTPEKLAKEFGLSVSVVLAAVGGSFCPTVPELAGSPELLRVM